MGHLHHSAGGEHLAQLTSDQLVMAKKNRNQRKKEKAHRSELSVTGLAEHKRIGKEVIPPFADLARRTPLSPADWVGDRLPEMLWASMLIAAFGRGEALRRFRLVGKVIEQRCKDDDDATRLLLRDVTLTGLSKWTDEDFTSFARAAIQGDSALFAVLLLFDDLPGKARWEAVIGDVKIDWAVLKAAVGITLWHQSQEATDCRWMRVLAAVLSRSLKLPAVELIREILEYPDYGDMREVRPIVRSSELACNMSAEGPTASEWSPKFWAQAYALTKTDHLPFRVGNLNPVSALTVQEISDLRNVLVKHWQNCVPGTQVDARLEAAFGFAAYALDIIAELIQLTNATSILGRMGLRTLVEAAITFTRLARRDDPELWKRFRDYGYGQAKLAYLKMLETDKLPSFISVEALEGFSNEDVWHEFQTINVGNWEGSDLRAMSDAVGLKADVYDRYYDWTSAFVHANWAAQRDAEYALCVNPLHRLHRVLATTKPVLPDVVHDAAILTNRILDVLHQLYPDFTGRLSTQTLQTS